MRKLRRAFTLLELIVVIVILGLLAAMVVPTFKNIIDTSKLEIVETTAASFARETVALAGLDTVKFNGKIMKEHAVLTANDMPQFVSTTPQAAEVTEGAQVVFSNWEFSGNKNVVSVKLTEDGSRMGVAIGVPNVGCAYALAEGNTVTSWNVKGIDVTNCNGAGAFADEEEAKGFLAPARPGGLKIGYGTCSPGVDGWMIEWDENVYVDIFINGVYQGIGKAKDLCIPGSKEDNVTVITRPNNPQDELIEELNPETPPAVRPGSAGSVGEVLDDEVIEIPEEQEAENPHNPKDPSQVEEEEIIIETPTTVVIDWDRTKVPSEAEELIIIKKPSNGPVREVKVPAGQEEAVNEELPPGDYTYVIRPVKDDKPVGPDLPVEVKPVEKPVPVPAAGGGGGGSAVTVVGDTVNLIWGTVPNAPQAPLTGYKVYRSLTNAGPWKQLSTVENNKASYSDAGLEPGTYYYTITSFGPGGESAMSVIARAEVVALPQVPVSFKAYPSNTQVRFDWGTVSSATSYIIYNAETNLPLKTVYTNSGTIEGLTNGQEYKFYVQAVNSAGQGNPSTVITATPNAVTLQFRDSTKIVEWLVPEGVTQVEATLRGGSGAQGKSTPSTGGAGAVFKVKLNVTPGEILHIKAGVNGNSVTAATPNRDGGLGHVYYTDRFGGNGGNSSDIRRGGKEVENRIVVAAGGGGGGARFTTGSVGGAGGLPGGNGGDFPAFSGLNESGKGGTQTGPGAGALGAGPGIGNIGGTGGSGGDGGGGGGGGGYFGGGGGSRMTSNASAGGGGGGSSYIAPGVTEGNFVTTNLGTTFVGVSIVY